MVKCCNYEADGVDCIQAIDGIPIGHVDNVGADNGMFLHQEYRKNFIFTRRNIQGHYGLQYKIKEIQWKYYNYRILFVL